MAPQRQSGGTRALTDDELAAVLDAADVGVLAFGGGTYPYPVPVALGYAAETDRLVVQLEGGPDSEKHRRRSRDGKVGLAVQDRTDDRWRSVLVQGDLREVAYQDAPRAVAALTESAERTPDPVVWSDLRPEETLTAYELVPAKRSGRAYRCE
ncbi:pyridoxamine 5'-phosphate oxidase family protein [Haloarcula litorea]|uniref:pyridoxamine 5'-phosphate oxidase family protein n=1 Tax=Haloarcula litorea TaxID=3032579 RepID=UPI0023E8A146|nr:pyridoxamine 5'-phosphate oxidase family protein [Halomicroarcula sp. GDY20]